MNRPIPSLVALALLIAVTTVACGRAPGAPPATAAPAATADGATAVIFRSRTCSCCHEHEAYMRAAGMQVHTVVDPNVTAIKESYGVPAEMYSCHTSDISGYFVEGHVPMAAIDRLLAEQPDLDGIALPGMPPGSPGMGGTLEGPLTVYGIKSGAVVGVFGEY